MIGYRLQERLNKILSMTLLLVVLVIVLFPIYWMLLTGIRPSSEIYKVDIKLWTDHPTLANVRNLFAVTPFPIQLRNSVIVAVVAVSLAVVVASLAGYSLSRLQFPGRDFMASAVFFAYLIPGTMTLIPLYVFLSRVGLLNSLYCLIIAYLSGSLPFSIWMLKGYFTTIPTELEHAALIDGCTRLQALYKVILPLAAPGIVSCAIFTFTLSWNQYMLPMIFNNSEKLWTLPVGLAGLVYGDVFLWGEIMSGSFLMSIPVLLLYIFGQRFVVTGLTAGAVKG
jgi:multiple sugar transport system permease protein